MSFYKYDINTQEVIEYDSFFKEFIYESEYDLTPLENQIQEKIKGGRLCGGVNIDNDSIWHDEISHFVTFFDKIDDRKYRIHLKFMDNGVGQYAVQYLDDYQIKLFGEKDENDKLKRIIRFDLVSKK